MPAIPEAMQRERYADECAAAGLLHEYEALIAAGNPPGFAAMLALQSPPGKRNTDQAFCEGQRRKMEAMPEANRKGIQKAAKRAGIQTNGKFYMSGVGRYDDPKAWVSSSQDFIDACKSKNMAAEGVINVKHQRTVEEAPQREALAPHLVSEMCRKELKADPALIEKFKKSKSARYELREKVIDKYGKKKRR